MISKRQAESLIGFVGLLLSENLDAFSMFYKTTTHSKCKGEGVWYIMYHNGISEKPQP